MVKTAQFDTLKVLENREFQDYGGIAQLGEQITSKAARMGEHKSESKKSKK